MASSLVFLLVLITTLFFCIVFSEIIEAEKTYIVYMGNAPVKLSPSTHHLNMLREIKGSKATGSIIHSYTKSFNGFVAKLTREEAQILARKEGVISVFENKVKKIQTTHSWEFLRMSSSTIRNVNESRIVIGMIDSGVWPESESFKDDGLSPPPSSWNGICQIGVGNFSCNNKIIGARFYRLLEDIPTKELRSPRDTAGHGTHTASTAAGAFVESASFYGIGSGIARGGVPAARIAVYKACWSHGGGTCHDADILAAFHDAIDDGVDIISISIGSSKSRPYFQDTIAIGSFHAHKNGILTCASAGNKGPETSTVSNNAPWLLSVAASTIDRRFVTVVEFEDGKILEGFSANALDSGNSMSELVQMACPTTEVDIVREKIILCQLKLYPNIDQIIDILHGRGAAGVLLPSFTGNQAQQSAYVYSIPEATLSEDDVNETLEYINSTSNPRARILKTSQRGDATAPRAANFSSRGPSRNDALILKPDVAAPGMNILAAWSPAEPITNDEEDNRHASFKILSGTSMACPHASAVAAYVKSFYPNWSPSAIMSALITTATPMIPEDNHGGIFACGAGNINPVSAIDPGLVYQTEADDYISVLCSEGYDSGQLQNITGNHTLCISNSTKTVWDLNYPSFMVYVDDITQPVQANFSRVLTNVGLIGTYQATVEVPVGFSILVEPDNMTFQSLGEEKDFQMFVRGMLTDDFAYGSLMWSDGFHKVRSPIIINSLHPEEGE